MVDQAHRRAALSTGSQRTMFKNLSMPQIRMIDEAMSAVGEFGEVHLVVRKGYLRFLVTRKSYDALKFRPGNFD